MKRTVVALIIAVSPLATGCGDKIITNSGPVPSASAPAAAAASAGMMDAGPADKGVEYSENDFVESDSNRDPFRNFVTQATNKSLALAQNQRKVGLPEYSVDELKLIAIVQSGAGNTAMLLPPSGKGEIVRRGDYVGRAEVVHVGGANGAEYPVNWRIDKIRDGDVVLIREDPNNKLIPPATRVLLLHPEQDKFNEKQG
jgi:type IV pilus assembly protein PilP